MLANWINSPLENHQGFTALHFAAFHGNPRMIKLLVKHGADIFAVNKQKMTMLHLAAQGDQPYSLTYFRELKLDINKRDSQNQTPLHWATFVQGASAMYYLLGWGVEINAKTDSGQTALHFAVKHAEKFGDMRSIKELLMKGADRSCRDNNGILPIDLIEDNVRNDETKQILRALLETPKNSRCIGVLALSGVRQPLVKMI